MADVVVVKAAVNVVTVKEYLQSNPAELETRHKDNGHFHEWRTLLHLASLHGPLEVVKYLVEAGANLQANDNCGNIPFLLASWKGRLQMVKYLAEAGATLEAKDSCGNTTLLLAYTSRL